MAQTKTITTLEEFLTPEEQHTFRQLVPVGRPHPISNLLSRDDGRTQHAVNTERALRRVAHSDRAWIEQARPRIVGADVIDAAAALAELRAYGALLEAGYPVKPVPTNPRKATPDFAIEDGATTTLVEVHAKQFYAMTEKEFQKHRKWISEQPILPGVTSYIHVLHPFGGAVPGKPGDSTTTNAISRICAIKQEEEQFRSDLPAILWLDFQDLYTMDMSMTVEQFQPVISWNEHLTTGALWYALYGWKGAPVFEQCHYSHLDLPSRIIRMAHDGRFFQPTKLSSVVVSFPKATILAESPIKEKQLPKNIRLRYMGLPWAGIQHTVAEWTSGLVVLTLQRHAALIDGLLGSTPPPTYPKTSAPS
jgi:hypothetical protein